MISSSDAYKSAIVAAKRRMHLKMVVDIADPDMVLMEPESSSIAPWTKPEELHDKVMDAPARYATLEKNRWLLDGSFDIFPDDYQVVENMGYTLDALSGNDGTYSEPQWLAQPISNVDILQAFSVYFSSDPLDGVAEDFVVDVLQGGTAYFTKEIVGNAATNISFAGFTVYNPDTIKITVTKWSKPSRRVRVVEIIPGVYEEWTERMLSAFDLKHQADFSCVSLPYGTCTISMDNLDNRFEPRNKAGIFKSLEEKQGMDVSIGVRLPDNTIDYKPAGRFYQYSGGWKTSDNGITMNWNLVDIIGLLADREFIVPSILPTTLDGWIGSIVGQLGDNFKDMYTVDPSYASKTLTTTKDYVSGRTCGDVLCCVCMATGTFPRADAENGKLAVEPLWQEGNKLTLDNMETYPTMRANDDVAAILFKLYDGNDTQYVVSGTTTAASSTIQVDNPFIRTASDALTAAKQILSAYGGNVFEVTGRGDPSSEVGDVDTVWLDESVATVGRRMYSGITFTNGIIRGCKSTLLQADGSMLFENRVVITEPGTYTAPEGATQLRVILVGKGGDGEDGTDGTWDEAGVPGADGLGALVWSGTININPQQTFDVSFGEHTVFGAYSSVNGKRYGYGYTDVASGESYARTGVAKPLPGSGDGGKGGSGGVKGNKHTEVITVPKSSSVLPTSVLGGNSPGGSGGGSIGGGTVEVEVEVIDNYPGPGGEGVQGATGCIVVYYDKE